MDTMFRRMYTGKGKVIHRFHKKKRRQTNNNNNKNKFKTAGYEKTLTGVAFAKKILIIKYINKYIYIQIYIYIKVYIDTCIKICV